MIKQMEITGPVGGGKTILMALLIEKAIREHGVGRVFHLSSHQAMRSQLVRRLSNDVKDKVLLCGVARLPKFEVNDLVIVDEMQKETSFLVHTRLKSEPVRVVTFRSR